MVATRLILDTDIGTDVDDCLALAVILGSPELQLEGVTCVYGDVQLRARMVLELLRLAGRDDVPVMLGVELPLLRRRPVFWPGHEGKGLLETAEATVAPAPEHAVDYLVRTIMENPGEIHLLAVGPLTNVALAMQREPRLAERLGHLTIMGGAGRGPGQYGLPSAEHNVKCDPEAAHVVLIGGGADDAGAARRDDASLDPRRWGGAAAGRVAIRSRRQWRGKWSSIPDSRTRAQPICTTRWRRPCWSGPSWRPSRHCTSTSRRRGSTRRG